MQLSDNNSDEERYVCSDEGFFYYETESKKVDIKELDIWQQSIIQERTIITPSKQTAE